MNAHKEEKDRKINAEVFHCPFHTSGKQGVYGKKTYCDAKGGKQRTPFTFQYKQHPLSVKEQQEDKDCQGAAELDPVQKAVGTPGEKKSKDSRTGEKCKEKPCCFPEPVSAALK